MIRGTYRILALLLFAGLLASCGTVAEQEAVEEQSAGTFAFNAQTSSGTLSGELSMGYGFRDTLTLEDGTQLTGPVSTTPWGDIYLYLSNFSGEGFNFINGSGEADGNGSFSGTFEGSLGGEDVSGNWTATPKGSGQNPPSDPTPDPTPNPTPDPTPTPTPDPTPTPTPTPDPTPNPTPDPTPTPPGEGETGQGNLTVNVLSRSSSNSLNVTVTAELVSGGSSSSVNLSGSVSGGSGDNIINQPVPAGDYQITVSGQGIEEQTISVTIAPGENKVVDIRF